MTLHMFAFRLPVCSFHDITFPLNFCIARFYRESVELTYCNSDNSPPMAGLPEGQQYHF
jgi:hypothetical protein